MSEKFSPALRLADLNDFIAPSQACIIPFRGNKASAKVEVGILHLLFYSFVAVVFVLLQLFEFPFFTKDMGRMLWDCWKLWRSVLV